MNLKILLFLIGLCCGLIGYHKFLVNDKPQTEKIIERIDTVFYEREKYVKDTVIVKQKIVQNHYDTLVLKNDSVFNSDDDSLKQAYFDEEIPTEENDSLRIIFATNSQAKSAIEYKNLWNRDSSLLDICEDNVKNCDESLDKIKIQNDSLKNIKPESNFYRDFGFGFGVGTLITIGTILVANELVD